MEHRTPIVLWAQRKDRVFVTIECPNADAPKVNLTDEGVLTFSAMAGTDSTEEKHRYDLKLELLHPVNAKDSKISVGPRHIVVVVQKTEEVSGRPARRPGAPSANAKPRARHSVPTRPERSNHDEKGSPARTRDLIVHRSTGDAAVRARMGGVQGCFDRPHPTGTSRPRVPVPELKDPRPRPRPRPRPQNSGPHWPRLLKQKHKDPHVKTDFDKWVDEDEEEEMDRDAAFNLSQLESMDLYRDTDAFMDAEDSDDDDDMPDLQKI